MAAALPGEDLDHSPAPGTGPAAPRGARTRPTARLRPPRWRDPRLLVGLALVVICMLGTWQLVARAAQTVSVWAAGAPLAPGTALREDHLTVVEVKLPQNAARYISAEQAAPLGMVLLEPLGEGELIPQRVLAAPDQLSGRVVSLQIPGTLPPGVQTGSRVDLWAAERGDDSEPVHVLADVPVVLVDSGGTEFGASRTTRLDLLVTPEDLPDVMRVLARDAHLTVVSIPER